MPSLACVLAPASVVTLRYRLGVEVRGQDQIDRLRRTESDLAAANTADSAQRGRISSDHGSSSGWWGVSG